MATYTTVDLSLGPFTVPAGVSEVTLYACGARGGYSGSGLGAYVRGTLPVAAGQVISAVMGRWPGNSAAGGAPDGKAGNGGGAGGGGSTAVKLDGVAVAIGAGGGGFGSNALNTGGPGDGGYPNGRDGNGNPGSGATQTADGTGTVGTNGGGGGGGLHKGGSGSSSSRAGGGGSSMVGASLTAVETGVGAGNEGVATVTYRNPVTPPAPTIIAPTAGGAAAAGTVRMSWAYGGEDKQAGASVEWRLSGGTAGAPASVTDATPYTEQTLTPGDWEWRANNTSQDGLTGPFSPWTPFHVETKPATPVLTSPADGATLTDVPVSIAWTGTASAWQAQIVNATTGVIVWDSGTQAGTATSTTGQATVDGITVTVRVRVKATYVYSDWAQVTCPVVWIGPVAPVVRLRPDPAEGRIGVEWTQPEGDVTPDHYDVQAVENGITFPVVSGLSADVRSTFHYLPLSDVDATIRVLAVAASGASTAGEAR